MILFILLVLTLFFTLAFLVAAISVGGAAFIIVFGDVIICALIIVCILRHLLRKK